ncbi:MAG: hypothetical protein OXS30_05445 [Chloroflexota bacterium]|nr:hypothetical protein [Chloroflexota bacterium]
MSVQIQEYELEDLFGEERIFERIREGSLIEVRREPIAQAKRWCSWNGESIHVRAVRADDPSIEVARIHYMVCGFGHVVAGWPSHIIIGGVLLYRRGHQRRPVE